MFHDPPTISFCKVKIGPHAKAVFVSDLALVLLFVN